MRLRFSPRSRTAAAQQLEQQRLEQLDAEREENREATAALSILTARRRELQTLLDGVYDLSDDEADRVESIWRELATSDAHEDLFCASEDEASLTEDSENSAQLDEAGVHDTPDGHELDRVKSAHKESLVAQRLQRARSHSHTCRSSRMPPPACGGDDDDESGCLVHPLVYV